MSTVSSITLVNPISGRGHLDAYARLYSRAFVELGLRVVLFAEADGGATDYLARTSPRAAPLFSFISFKGARAFATSVTPGQIPASSLARRARVVWQKEGAVEVVKRALTFALERSLSHIPVPIRRRVSQLKHAIGRRMVGTRLERVFDLSAYADLDRVPFQDLVYGVRTAATMKGQSKPDLILFLYLDLMAERAQNTFCLDQCGAPWVGILFHPRLARDPNAKIEGYFDSPKARGGLFVVPAAISKYAEATPHLTFALAPDVADLELPATPPRVAHEMRQRAGARKIVLQIGTVGEHKDIPTLLDVVGLADSSQFFFALIGEVHWDTFETHKERIRKFYACPPENAFVFEGYIGDERDYNGVILASDIVYAVYRDFSGSSNSLTKAAGIRRPILVSERSLMGERVCRFDIGDTAPESNATPILQRLQSLAARPLDSFGFDAFNREHSLEALKARLVETIPAWLAEVGSQTTA